MITTDMNDWSLLRQYVERRSEAAFESLVRRHLDMVYSAAWRQTGCRPNLISCTIGCPRPGAFP
jgi:hypothetical protein